MEDIVRNPSPERKCLLSIIVPCKNEEQAVPIFYSEFLKVAEKMGKINFEIIFVEDGSTDNTLGIIRDMSAKDPRVRYISFSRNFGKEAAMSAGLKYSMGDYVAIMDADLQDPPQLLPQMFKKMEESGCDCVAARRMTRDGEPKIRSFLARSFYKILNSTSDLKFTEGAFKDWGYQLAREEFGGELIDGGPWLKVKNPNTGKEIVIKDVIADAFLQQILLRPAEYDVIACMNLNGDYISDALAAQVGGIGIAPGANIGDECALFEATHGTAPKYAGQDKVNPGSIILSAEMMLRHMGWTEAADLIVKGMEGAINAKTVTYDFERLMEGAKLLKCSEFGDAIIKNM